MSQASQVALVVKNPPANIRDVIDIIDQTQGLIPESERSPGGGHDNPLQYSCLESFMDRRDWSYTPWGRKESD